MPCDATAFDDQGPTPRASEPGPAAALIVDERPIVRDAVWRLAEACGLHGPPLFASSLETALRLEPRAPIRLAVVDLFTARYDFRALGRFIALVAPTPVVLLDDRMNAVFAELAQGAGAAAYGAKDQEVEALQTVLQGALTPRPGAPASVAAQLTRRQWEVLRLIEEGRSTQEMSDQLRITPGTVKLHVHRVLRATGARNRLEAALIAQRLRASGCA